MGSFIHTNGLCIKYRANLRKLDEVMDEIRTLQQATFSRRMVSFRRDSEIVANMKTRVQSALNRFAPAVRRTIVRWANLTSSLRSQPTAPQNLSANPDQVLARIIERCKEGTVVPARNNMGTAIQDALAPESNLEPLPIPALVCLLLCILRATSNRIIDIQHRRHIWGNCHKCSR